MKRNPDTPALTLLPRNRPFRWFPRNGNPTCIGEWASQRLIKWLAFLPIYIGIIVALILVVQLFHPFGLGEGL